MKKMLVVLIAFSMLATGILTALPRADAEAPKPAVAAATEWLHQVDRADYAGSWDEAATYFKEAVGRDAWVAQIKAVRAPLGDVVSRKVIGARALSSLPGAPDGEYVVIQIETEFANKKSAVETITPMRDGARGWRVSGYYIR